ncbi:MAG TPA: Rid family detoxifying hydrolase [Candidatus Paenalcaligenes intestinipullorum]|uniref:Rid family detoxifying hydrolase n=1 Tax=Candidatus Paenalcaligenes intestinipullorum TaxID=2838718 RepID=A0A9D2U944_9BURK|nr:Rid family detoxifying hydrolase [Candidatus Paenalcaligenes intestinipullorum]
MSKHVIQTHSAPAAVGPYSQAIVVDSGQRTVFLSGQIALTPETGDLVSENFDEQVIQCFKNIEAVAEACGASLSNIVKLNLYLTDLSKFATANALMGELLPQPYPARSTVEVASLPKGAQIEIEAILAI